MEKVYWRPMVVGPLFAVVRLLALVTGIVLPFLDVIVSFDPGVVAVFLVSPGAPVLGAVVPAGSKSEMVAWGENGNSAIYRMPDVDAGRMPYFEILWGLAANTSASEDSWLHETQSKSNGDISDYHRSNVEWPGARAAVVATWTLKVDLGAGDGCDWQA